MSDNPLFKIVLAYSGGLDTSVIARWLQTQYQAQVVTFTADIGQNEEIEPARIKAQKMGIHEIYIEDLRESFVTDYVFPMFRANPLYEAEYLLGTAIARPLIAKRLTEIAQQVGAKAICHGATGKGNDQVRFELAAIALSPHLKIIAPWREWAFNSRTDLIDYANTHDIDVETDSENRPDYSMDANLLHISYEGGKLEDPASPPDEDMWRRTRSITDAPNHPVSLKIGFIKGDPVSLDDIALKPASLLDKLNQIAGEHAIGRVDMVENRYLGIKSRGCYETPGGSVLLKARRALESITLDREQMHLKDDLMPRYARLVYNGYWFSPERHSLQKLIDDTQGNVTGEVVVHLHKGNVIVRERRSSASLFDAAISSFENDGGAFDQKDAQGFINLNALRLKLKAKN